MKPPSERAASTFEVVYLEHLALNEKPFGSADPVFFFESRSHVEALKVLTTFLDHEWGIALLCGEVGAGKTIVCRRFVESLDKSRFDVAFIPTPSTDGKLLFAEVAGHFDAALPSTFSAKEAAQALALSLALQKRRRIPVLAIDEAEALSHDALEALGELFRKETTESGESLRVMLFGRDELVARLLDGRLGHVRRHVATTHYLQALSAKEVGPYIRHRLGKAGSPDLILFSEEAVDDLHAASRGRPGIIDALCGRCLFHLYEESKRVVDREILGRALNESGVGTGGEAPNMGVRYPRLLRELASHLKYFLPAAFIIVAALVVLYLLFLRFRPVPGH